MRESTTYVPNIKKYLLAPLYNSLSTIDNYYAALVKHGLYDGVERRQLLMREEITQCAVSLSSIFSLPTQ